MSSKELLNNLGNSSSSKDVSIIKSKSDLKPISKYTGNIYKIRSGPLIQDPRSLSKICPRKIITEKEKLYEENLHLKQIYNFIAQENIKLRTKIQQLEKNSEKKENVLSPKGKKSHLIENLKINIKDLKSEIQAKDKGIEDIKKYVRYTKMQELEADLMQYTNECMRLKKIIDGLLVEKNIVPQGLDFYEKIKRENEELHKTVKYFKDNDQTKTEKIEELIQIINSKHQVATPIGKNSFADQEQLVKENESLKKLFEAKYQELEEKDSLIKELKETVSQQNNIIDSLKSKENIRTESEVSIKSELQGFCDKIKEFFSSNNINSKDWILSINSSGVVSKNELKKALIQDDIVINDPELSEFMQRYGENDDQILSSVFAELFDKSELEVLDIQEIFEELKAKATCNGLKSIEDYLQITLTDYEVSQSDIQALFSNNVFKVSNPLSLSLLKSYFFGEEEFISKEAFVSRFISGFNDWCYLKKPEIKGILLRFNMLLFDSYEEILCRLQEKTRFQSYASMKMVLEEFRIHGLADSDSEQCCARSLIYTYSNSVKRIPYLQILYDLYTNLASEKFMSQLSGQFIDDESVGSMNSFQATETENLDINN